MADLAQARLYGGGEPRLWYGRGAVGGGTTPGCATCAFRLFGRRSTRAIRMVMSTAFNKHGTFWA
jgi:hypothetical protein